MDDEVAVGVGDRVAHLEEQLQLPRERQAAGEVDDGHAVDEFHRHERMAVVVEAAVVQPRDAGVFEPGDDRALVLEAVEIGRGVDRDDLERGALGKAALGARRLVDRAHPAVTDRANNLPRADAGAGRKVG